MFSNLPKFLFLQPIVAELSPKMYGVVEKILIVLTQAQGQRGLKIKRFIFTIFAHITF